MDGLKTSTLGPKSGFASRSKLVFVPPAAIDATEQQASSRPNPSAALICPFMRRPHCIPWFTGSLFQSVNSMPEKNPTLLRLDRQLPSFPRWWTRCPPGRENGCRTGEPLVNRFSISRREFVRLGAGTVAAGAAANATLLQPLELAA